jgi:hypothetical protein
MTDLYEHFIESLTDLPNGDDIGTMRDPPHADRKGVRQPRELVQKLLAPAAGGTHI